MFEKLFDTVYLDRKACSYFYILMIAALKIIYFLILFSFVYFLWEQRHSYMSLFETDSLMKAHQDKNWDEYLALFKMVGVETIYLLVKVLVIACIIKVLKISKIPNIWLRKWDEDAQINNVFGKNLAHHLRFNRKINFKDFYELDKISKLEAYNLYKIGRDKNLTYILEKYDSEYKNDTNN